MRASQPLFLILLAAAIPAQTAANPGTSALQAKLAEISSTSARVRFLLSKAEDTPGPQTAQVETLLAKEPGIRSRLRRYAATSSSVRIRRTALAALLQTGDDKFVCRRAVTDKSDAVRTHLAQRYTASQRTAAAVAALTPHLTSRTVGHRIRAAKLLLALKDAKAIPALQRALRKLRRRASATRGPKVYIANIRQKSIVRDFDAEIASSSFIADPKTDVVQDGTVLGTEVLASRTQRFYADSIRTLNAYFKAKRRAARLAPKAARPAPKRK